MTTYDVVHMWDQGGVAYRTCSECVGIDRADFQGPAGHFRHCSKFDPDENPDEVDHGRDSDGP